eukprot:GFUD01021898.1.p1 GENE.GFUD01021898.1~~GFUD01021898.1.p1  ORF type:complete len:232 (+),score=53.80 GFUD01021898.1:27-698(+)
MEQKSFKTIIMYHNMQPMVLEKERQMTGISTLHMMHVMIKWLAWERKLLAVLTTEMLQQLAQLVGVIHQVARMMTMVMTHCPGNTHHAQIKKTNATAPVLPKPAGDLHGGPAGGGDSEMTRPLSPSPGEASDRQGRVGSAATADQGPSYDVAGSQLEGTGVISRGWWVYKDLDICPAHPATDVQAPPVVHSDRQAQPAPDQDVSQVQALRHHSCCHGAHSISD